MEESTAAALAAAKNLKAGKKIPKPQTKAKTAKTKKPTESRGNVPFAKIAALYNQGKSTAEISDSLGLTKKKTVDGKENKYPYYTVVGALYKLSQGITVNGEIIKIKRGKKTVKKAA
jgi:hypothetical protein